MRDVLEAPPRPYIPPSALAAASCIAMAAILLELSWHDFEMEGFGAVYQVAPTVLVGVVALSGAIGSMRLGAARPVMFRRLLGELCLGAAIAAFAMAAWGARSNAMRATLSSGAGVLGRCTVEGDPSVNDYGASFTLRLGDGVLAPRVRATADAPYEAGDRVRVTGRLEPLAGEGWARGRFMHGELASLKVVTVEVLGDGAAPAPILALRRRVLQAIDPGASPARALLAGVVCGRITELNGLDASDDFSRCGLSHLIAVSGGHLVLIASLLESAFGRAHVARRRRSALLAAVMLAYVVFTGGAPSAARSFAMVAVGLAVGLAGRRAHGVSALIVTTLVLVALDPGTMYDLGFQLSALSVLFIALFSPHIAYLLERMGVPRAVAGQLSLTCAAMWATLPVTMPVFGELSLVSPFANLLVGPLMSGALVAGVVACPLCLTLPSLADVLLVPASWCANISIWCAGVLGSLPLASLRIEPSVPVLAGAYLAAALFHVARPDPPPGRLRALLGAVAAGLSFVLASWRFAAPPRLTVLDVGQADAILIRDGPAAVLVDAGVDDSVLDALARQHVLHLDAVLITHWDRDHWGGLPDILEELPVDRVLVAEGASAGAPGELASPLRGMLAEVAYGDRIEVGGFSAEVVWPREEVEGGENGESLCLDVSFSRGGASLTALLTGDTELEEERVYAPDVGDVDVLKIGHHGSKASLDAGLLDALSPEVAIASAGAGNHYGHPSEECVGAVEGAGALFLCTRDAGDVVIEPRRDGVGVHVSKR